MTGLLGIIFSSSFVFADVGEANLDNDPSEGDLEVYCEDPNLAPGMIETDDLDSDGDFDTINFGVEGGGELFAQAQLDGASDVELVVSDPTLETGEVRSADADNDGDAEVVWIGTQGADFDQDEVFEVEESGAIIAIIDLDGDGNNEVAVADTSRFIGEFETGSFGLNSGDNFEVVWIGILGELGIARGATFIETVDFDGDGEREVILEDIQIVRMDPSFGGVFMDVDGDGDDDVIIRVN